MAKLVVSKAGYFITIPLLGSFRSPVKIKVPDSLVNVVKTILLKNGVEEFSFTKEEKVTSKTENKQDLEKSFQKENTDIKDVMKKLSEIQFLVEEVLRKESIVKEVIIDKDELRIRKGKPFIPEIGPEDIEYDIFVPSVTKKISSIDLTVKTSEKDDISSRVESLSNLKKK